jgi:hypothetical protein
MHRTRPTSEQQVPATNFKLIFMTRSTSLVKDQATATEFMSYVKGSFFSMIDLSWSLPYDWIWHRLVKVATLLNGSFMYGGMENADLSKDVWPRTVCILKELGLIPKKLSSFYLPQFGSIFSSLACRIWMPISLNYTISGLFFGLV